MTIMKIEQEFNNMFAEYRKMYEERLIELLKTAGVYNRTVLFKSDDGCRMIQKPLKGVLEMYPETYHSIQWSIKFCPFKKDGSLSLNSRNLYLGNINDEEKFIERLLKCVEPIDD